MILIGLFFSDDDIAGGLGLRGIWLQDGLVSFFLGDVLVVFGELDGDFSNKWSRE